MVVVYLVWGDRLALHLEAAFSMLTVLADAQPKTVCVVTDYPEYYAFLKDRIDIQTVTSEKFREWRGPRDFMFRLKVMGFQYATERYPGKDILYLDSDTFFRGSLAKIQEHFDNGGVCMHETSGSFCKLTDNSNKRLWKHINGRKFLDYTVDSATQKYNAGVVGIPGAVAADLIRDILGCTDELFARSGHFNAEETTYSTILQSRENFRTVDDHVGHYWGNRPQWNSIVSDFFNRCFTAGMSLEEMISASVRDVDFSAIPVHVSRSRRYRQLTSLVGKIWQPRHIRYFTGEKRVER